MFESGVAEEHLLEFAGEECKKYADTSTDDNICGEVHLEIQTGKCYHCCKQVHEDTEFFVIEENHGSSTECKH